MSLSLPEDILREARAGPQEQPPAHKDKSAG